MSPKSPNIVTSAGRQFTWHEVVDYLNEVVASSFSHPSDWQAQSQLTWNLQNTSLPVQVYATAYNPQGAECCEFFPPQVFFWIEGGWDTYHVGQNAHGFVFMPPRPAPDALAGLVIPAFRRDRPTLRVTHVQPVPQLWQRFNDPPPQNGEGVLARVEYEIQGRPVEEEFYGIYSWAQAVGQLNWGFGRLASFRAERGRLGASRETFWRIAASGQVNPQWTQRYNEVCQQLQAGHRAQIEGVFQRLGREGELRSQIIANSNQFLEQRTAQMNASYEAEQRRRAAEQTQQREYTLNDARGDVLSGKTAYHDPNDPGNFHYDDSYSQYVWTDEMGHFHHTNDPFDDPNVGGDRTWTRARRADGND